MSDQPKLRPFGADEGEYLTLADFDEHIDLGLLTDYDGFAEYATKDQVSDVRVKPSTFRVEPAPVWATHVFWYNK